MAAMTANERSAGPVDGSKALVSARAVHKWFGEQHVLRGVDLDVARGEVVALIGPSGSGKTTFLRCVNFLEDYQGGAIHVDGELVGYERRGRRLFERRESEIARARSRVGMVFQHFNLFPHLSVLGNVVYGPRRVLGVPKAEAVEHAVELLAQVGLRDKADAMPSTLSGGQQQRVGIARALAMRPSLLLLDEPTSALDPELVGEVLAVVRNVAAQGMTMVIVTHELAFARDVADTVVFMEAGRVVERGPVERVFGNAREERTRRFLKRQMGPEGE